jgi:IS30 family transposase
MPYVQLTSEERYVIYHLKLFKLSLREIARRLGRHHTTISREIQRNGPVISSWAYWHESAQQREPAGGVYPAVKIEVQKITLMPNVRCLPSFPCLLFTKKSQHHALQRLAISL